MTGRRAACLAGLIALLVGAPAWAIERTVAGRPLELTGWLELREIIRANRSSPNELVLEQLSYDPDPGELYVAYPRLTEDDVKACIAYARQALRARRYRSRPISTVARER